MSEIPTGQMGLIALAFALFGISLRRFFQRKD
jgi:hypothetical protein